MGAVGAAQLPRLPSYKLQSYKVTKLEVDTLRVTRWALLNGRDFQGESLLHLAIRGAARTQAGHSACLLPWQCIDQPTNSSEWRIVAEVLKDGVPKPPSGRWGSDWWDFHMALSETASDEVGGGGSSPTMPVLS